MAKKTKKKNSTLPKPVPAISNEEIARYDFEAGVNAMAEEAGIKTFICGYVMGDGIGIMLSQKSLGEVTGLGFAIQAHLTSAVQKTLTERGING